MAIRKRTISPMIWEDPAFNQLSISARFIFVGMISNSNDEGFIRSDSGSIKRLLFGFDETTKEDIKKWLKELTTFKNIHFYVVREEVYAHFINWDKYQKQQKDRIQLNEYPPCSICLTPAKQVLTEVKGSKGKGSKVNIDTKVSKELLDTKNNKNINGTYGNPLINELVSFLKTEVGLSVLDDSEKTNRRFASLCIKKFGFNEIKEIIKKAKDSDFWATRITGFKTIYYNGVKIQKLEEERTYSFKTK